MSDPELERLTEQELVERFTRMAEQAQRDLARLSEALIRAADALDNLAARPARPPEAGNIIPFRPRPH